MQKKVDVNMSSLEREIYEIFLNSDKPLSSSDILQQCPSRKWFDRSLHPVLNRLEEKKLITISGYVKVARSKARLYQSTLTRTQFIQACHREHFELIQDGSLDTILSALSGYKKDRDQSIINEVEVWLEKQKKNLKNSDGGTNE
jgi:predicted transcriptional regulator